MTAPLTPPECDLRGMPFMPLDVVRLLDSDLFALSTGDEFKAAIALWCKSWNQRPAASLPCDDRIIARLAGLSLREWAGVKATALRGWVLCDDGRLYHPVVAEKAVEAWAARERQRARVNSRWEKERARRAEAHDAESLPASTADGGDCNAVEDTAVHTAEGAAAIQGTGTGTVKEDADASSLGACAPAKSPGRRKPEGPIPDGYPDDAAVASAQTMLREARVNLDARVQAERFRNHAQQNDRRCRDWAAAWRNWLSKALEGAPRPAAASSAPLFTKPPPWPGPPDLRAAIAAYMGEEWTSWKIDGCGWRDLPVPAIVAPNRVTADLIVRDVGHRLREAGVAVEIAERGAA